MTGTRTPRHPARTTPDGVASPPRAAAPAVVLLEDVHRRYSNGRVSVQALEGVSLTVRAGEFVALVGPSGCGKSTLLNLISAVDRPDAGRVVVCGTDLAAAREADLTRLRRRSIGVVFQAFHLMPNLTASENVALPLALDGRRDDARVARLLDRVGLGARGDHYPSELSGGEQQRVAIARALANGPHLVVADEPTGNLDSHTGVEILDLLGELHRAEGTALVVATHDDRVAARADTVCALRDGRLAGTPAG